MRLMTIISRASRSTSLTRRAVCASFILLCLTMAGSNLVSAFAETTAPLPTENIQSARLSPDLMANLSSSGSSVIVTAQSMETKTQVVSAIQSIFPGTVHDDYSSLPIVTVDSVTPSNIDALSKVQGISSIEPARHLTHSSYTTAEYLDWIKGTNVLSNNTPLKGKGMVFGVLDTGLNVDHPMFKGADGKTRVVAQACFQDSPEVAPCPAPGAPNQANVTAMCAPEDAGCFHGSSVTALAVGNFVSLTDNKNTNYSIQGVAPQASISIVRLAESKAADSISEENVLAALNKFVADAQAHSSAAPDVLNLSLGFTLEGNAQLSVQE